MTNQEHKDIVRVAGIGYEYEDIPTYIRTRDDISKEDWEYAEKAEFDKILDLQDAQIRFLHKQISR